METELFCSSCADIKESQVKHLIRSSYLGNVQWCWINMNELFLIRLVWVWDFFQLSLGYNGSKAKSQQPYIASLGKKLLSILPVVLFCFMFIVYNKKKKKWTGKLYLPEPGVGVWSKNNPGRRSLQMIGSLHCNLRDNKEHAECLMHYNHRQEEARVKTGSANVVICSVQSLQLGIFIWCCWRERGMRKLEECSWINT